MQDNPISRFKALREGLRRELESRGHTVSQYFEQLDGKPLGLNFQNNVSGTINVFWGPKTNRQKAVDLDPKAIADMIIRSMAGLPPQPIRRQQPQQQAPQQPKPKPQQPPARSAKISGVLITDEEYQEFLMLRSKASQGVWISHAAYAAMQEEMRIGYIPPKARTELLDTFDRLLRRMKCD